MGCRDRTQVGCMQGKHLRLCMCVCVSLSHPLSLSPFFFPSLSLIEERLYKDMARRQLSASQSGLSRNYSCLHGLWPSSQCSCEKSHFCCLSSKSMGFCPRSFIYQLTQRDCSLTLPLQPICKAPQITSQAYPGLGDWVGKRNAIMRMIPGPLCEHHKSLFSHPLQTSRLLKSLSLSSCQNSFSGRTLKFIPSEW